MLRQAIDVLTGQGHDLSAAQKADVLESYCRQISAENDGWQWIRLQTSDGGTAYAGQQGELLLIGPTGRMYRGSVGTGFVGGHPNYEALEAL